MKERERESERERGMEGERAQFVYSTYSKSPRVVILRLKAMSDARTQVSTCRQTNGMAELCKEGYVMS